MGEVAISKQNYKKITNAYKIIVERQLGLGGKLNFQNRKNCRDYILFDTINDIFMNEKNGQLYLCEQIYEALYELLAENHQYLHQYAKCCLRTSHIIHEIAEKKEYIKKGGNYTIIFIKSQY